MRNNTIYIMSKGRPQCHTARTLVKLKYPGDWFIVCGDNDETIEEYKRNWGESKVIVFDWKKYFDRCDFMDNSKSLSGAIPARNAIKDIAKNRGEIRHWQFDDDYTHFRWFDCKTLRWRNLDGNELLDRLQKLADFGESIGASNIGFDVATVCANGFDGVKFVLMPRQRVFNCHNLTTEDKLWIEWRGRMNDDLLNSIWAKNHGYLVMSTRNPLCAMSATQQEKGGLTELYKEQGTVTKTAYGVLGHPKAVKLTNFKGRYHHHVDWKSISPCIVKESK